MNLQAPVYQIRQNADSNSEAVPIESTEFFEIKEARRIKESTTSTEQNYWLFYEAHHSFQLAIQNAEQELSSSLPNSVNELPFLRMKLAATMDYCLFAFRRYVDNFKSILKETCDEQELENLTVALRNIHTNNFEYRLCNKLRNYTAHHVTAAHGVRFSSVRKKQCEPRKVIVSVTISAKELLRWHSAQVKGEGLDATLLSDIQNRSQSGQESIDISVALTKTASLVATFHNSVRNFMTKHEIVANEALNRFIEKWKSVKQLEPDCGLVAELIVGTNTDAEEPVSISAIPDDHSTIEIRKRTEHIAQEAIQV